MLFMQVFHGWRQHLVDKRVRDQKCIWLLRRSSRHLLFNSWALWKQWVSTNRRHRALVERKRHRHALATLLQAFRGWAASARSSAQIQSLAVPKLSRAFQIPSTSVFTAWRMVAQRAAASRKCVSVCMQQLQKQCMSHAFSAWVVVVRSAQAAKGAAENLRQKGLTAVLTTVFASWRDEWELQRHLGQRAERLAQKRMHRKLCSAFLEWRAETYERLCHDHSIMFATSSRTDCTFLV